ncbi:threonine-phosphate decarboxylase CobD [Paenibacillus taiwanensis]|uniref:threonine-phosphate decarboxylase CobD n=1 Tax=Paenibacillus taiwanensis TaxID=401638 RepID=UPI00040E7F4A|nr:threonine-phosphate decarboxylase CobD [Paenibacillus taiwanensis]
MTKIERYGHGGDVWTAAATFGGRTDDFLDYSANINPLGPPLFVSESLKHAWDRMLQYPDPAHRILKASLADRLQVAESQLMLGNGAAECMALVLLAYSPRLVGVVSPCFSEYESLAKQYGANVLRVTGKDPDYRATEEQIVSLIREVEVCFIGHPNNPTGALYDKSILRKAAIAAEHSGCILVIDEAFIDFLDDEAAYTALPLLSEFNHIVILRSLTKFYAIPGLRLGYALAAPARIAELTRKQVTWSVNGLALAAGEALFDKNNRQLLMEYEHQTRSVVKSERAWMEAQLTTLGVRSWQSAANFILCYLPAPWSAEKLQQQLGMRGILIRSCAMYDGLQEGHFRLAVKDRAANERLMREIEDVLRL